MLLFMADSKKIGDLADPPGVELSVHGQAVWREFSRLVEPVFLVRPSPFSVTGANAVARSTMDGEASTALTDRFKEWLTPGAFDSMLALLAAKSQLEWLDIPVWTRGAAGRRAQSLSVVPLPQDADSWGSVILVVRGNHAGLSHLGRASWDEFITQLVDILPYPSWVTGAGNKWICNNAQATKLLAWLPCEYGAPGASPTEAASLEWRSCAAQVRVAGLVETLIDLGAGGSWRLVRCLLDGAGTDALGCVAFPLPKTGVQQAEPSALTARSGSASVQAARECERAALAREIHDSLGQELTVLRLTTERLQRELSQDNPLTALQEARFAEVNSQVDNVIAITRRIAIELRQDLVSSHGLAHAANALVQDFGRRLMIPGQLEISEGWPEPEVSMGQNLYRMLQELLNNLAKHAQASRFMVRLTFVKNSYELEVVDDGCGTQAHFATPRASSIGLRSMRERAELYNGQVSITSRPTVAGTMIKIRLPERRLATTPLKLEVV